VKYPYYSQGELHYSFAAGIYKVIVEVDPGIVEVTRALLPPTLRARFRPQRYAPHITVLRGEVPPKLDKWAAWDGEEVSFVFDPEPVFGVTYAWLAVEASALIDLRVGLGLPPSSPESRPPDDTESFHCTIGNCK
jgi:hypothetical protein